MPEMLNHGELDLLQWLGEADFSQYGECHGKALDKLVAEGLAQVHGRGEHQHFIAKEPTTPGEHLMFRAVSLTEEGRALWRALPKNRR